MILVTPLPILVTPLPKSFGNERARPPFLVVKFRRIRVFGGYFGLLDKFRLPFHNFVGLPSVVAKINENFSSKRSLIQLSCVVNLVG